MQTETSDREEGGQYLILLLTFGSELRSQPVSDKVGHEPLGYSQQPWKTASRLLSRPNAAQDHCTRCVGSDSPTLAYLGIEFIPTIQ